MAVSEEMDIWTNPSLSVLVTLVVVMRSSESIPKTADQYGNIRRFSDSDNLCSQYLGFDWVKDMAIVERSELIEQLKAIVGPGG